MMTGRDAAAKDAGEADIVGDRHHLVLIGLGAVWLACLVFAGLRLAVTATTGKLTPWWGNVAGLFAITALYLWYRRAPQARSSGAAHGTALVALLALLVPVAYGMDSTMWWLSLVGFAMVLLGRRQEAWVWGVAIPLVTVAAVLAGPHIQVAGAAAEPAVESALAQIVFVVILIGMAAAFRHVAEQRAAALHAVQSELRSLKNEFEARAKTGEDLAARRLERLVHLNSVLRAIRNVNQLIVHEKDPARLVQQACDTLVETRGYPSAWIRLDGDDGSPRAIGLAGWACGDGVFATHARRGEAPPCTGQVITSGQVVTLLDPATCGDCPLRQHYQQHAAAGVAVRYESRTFGMLGVAIPGDTTVADPEEISLLDEIAGDLGFALHTIETGRAQRRSEEQFRVSFNQAAVGQALASLDGRFLEVNAAMTRLLGRSAEELVGREFNSITHPEDFAVGLDALDALRQGQPLAHFTKRYLKKDGGTVWVDVSVAVVKGVDDVPSHFMATMFDVTVAKQAEAERAERARLLAETSALSLELTSASAATEIPEIVARRLRRMTDAVAVVFSEYDETDRVLVPLAVDMPAELREAVVRSLGADITAVRSPVTAETYREIVAQPVGRRRSLSEVTFGAVPPPIAVVVQEILDADRFIGISHVIDGHLFGTSVLMLRTGQTEPETGWLSSVASIAAMALRRSHTERSLAESETKFRLLADHAGVGMGYYDPEGRLLFFNARASELMGGPPHSFVGKSLFELYPRDLAGLIMTRLHEVMERGESRTFEDEVSLPGAGKFWFLSTYNRVTDDAGRNLGLQILSADVTATKRAEEKIRTLARFPGDNPAPVLRLAAGGRLLYANPAAITLLPEMGSSESGPAPEPFSGNAITAIETGAIQTFELAVAGREFEFVAAPVLEDGHVNFYGSDITHRKQAEAEIRFQRMLLESQNEASLDGILNVDGDGRIVWFNRRFVELWGIPLGAVASGPNQSALAAVLDKLVEPDAFAARVAEIYAQPSVKSRDEIQLKDGRIFDRYSSPVTSAGGIHLGRVWLFRDVTDMRKLQASLAQSDRLTSMGMLAAGVAHEINNPLSYILYNLESLSQDLPGMLARMRRCHAELTTLVGDDAAARKLGDDQQISIPAMFDDVLERLRDARSGSEQIKKITRSLGTFSRVEQTDLAPVNLHVALDHAITMAFNEIKYRAGLVKDFGEIPPVLASDGKLAQVFLNLLINAAHAIGEGHVDDNQIRVRTFTEDGQACVEISDTGRGIPPEQQERIFEPFFTTKGVGVGSGLGLSICKNIISAFGGEIGVTSEVGKGTRFLIRLPPMPGEWHTDAPSVPGRRSTEPVVRGRILVIDDEAGIRAAIARLLRGAHEVVTAVSGEEGRRVLERDRGFDLIFCDLMMPEMSGMELHAWLAEADPKLAEQIVFITGGVFTPGASDYLAQVGNLRVEKPFDTTSLRRMADELVQAARSRGARG